MAISLVCHPLLPSSSLLFNARSLSTTLPLAKNTAGKYRKTPDRSFELTYQMYRRPTHIGVSKGFMTIHSQNLEGFRQQQPVTIAQDEVVNRFMRGLFYTHLTANGTEFVIKRRGNVLYVTGFLQYGTRLKIRKLYWLIGFTEELLSNLLKQPVKLEIQFVEDHHKLTVTSV